MSVSPLRGGPSGCGYSQKVMSEIKNPSAHVALVCATAFFTLFAGVSSVVAINHQDPIQRSISVLSAVLSGGIAFRLARWQRDLYCDPSRYDMVEEVDSRC